MTQSTPENRNHYDPLGLCNLKFEEAYRFAMEGMNLRAINGIEVASFVAIQDGRTYFYVLERPTLDDPGTKLEMAYLATELSYPVDSRWMYTGGPALDELVLRDFAVNRTGDIVEVLDGPTLEDGRVDILGDGTFDISHLDMRVVAAALENEDLYAAQLNFGEKRNLLDRLRKAVPADH